MLCVDQAAFRIRTARSGDLAALAGLWRALRTEHADYDPLFQLDPAGERSTERRLLESVRDRDACVLVAENDAQSLIAFIMGMILARPPLGLSGRFGFIAGLYVQDVWRRQGVGKALFLEMEQWLHMRKVTGLQLYVFPENRTGMAFWQAMGLRPFLTLLTREL